MNSRAKLTERRTLGIASLVFLTSLLLVGQEVPGPALIAQVGRVSGLTAMAVSPDGDWFVTLRDNEATIWSARDGAELRSFAATKALPTARTISVSADSSVIATSGGLGQLYVIDATTAQVKQSMKIGMGAPLVKMEFHPSKMLLATLDQTGSVRIIDISHQRTVFEAATKVSFDSSLHFSPDGSLLGESSKTEVHVWNWSQQSEIAHFEGHATHSTNLDRKLNAMVLSPTGISPQVQTAEQMGYYEFVGFAFSTSGRSAALVHRDEIDFVDLTTESTRATIPSLKGELRSCIFVGENVIIVGGQDMSFVYNLQDHSHNEYPAYHVSEFLSIPKSTNILMRLSDQIGIKGYPAGKWQVLIKDRVPQLFQPQFSPDGKEIIAGINQWDAPMTVWNLSSGTADTTLIPAADVNSFAQSANGTRIAYYGNEGYPSAAIHIWNRDERREESTIPIVVPGLTQSLSFSPQGDRLAALVGEPKAMKLWSAPEGTLLATVPIDENYVNRLAFSPDGRTIAIVQKSGLMIVDTGVQPPSSKTLDLEKSQQLAGLNALTYSPDGSLLAVSGTGSTYLLKTSSWTVADTIPNTAGICLAFSPDGKHLAFISEVPSELGPERGGLAIWDLALRRVIGRDESQTADCPLSFNPEGTLVAAGSDGGITLLSSENAKKLVSLYRFGAGSAVEWLSIAPDGHFDGTANGWKQLSWRFSNNTFDTSPVEIFFRDFFAPRLVGDLVARRSLPVVGSLASLNRTQPKVDHLQVQPETALPGMVTVTIAVESERSSVQRNAAGQFLHSGVYDVRLFRDGQLVGQMPNVAAGEDEKLGPITSEGEREAWRRLHQVKLDAEGKATVVFHNIRLPRRVGVGHVNFSAYAFNADRVKSLTTPGYDYQIPSAAPGRELARTAYLITMGVNANQSHWNMDVAVSSAEQARKALGNKLQEKYANIVEIPLYSDLAPNSAQVVLTRARKANLQAVLDLLAGRKVSPELQDEVDPGHHLQTATPDDAVVLYVASHGYADPLGNYYLVPYDTGLDNWTTTEDVLTRCKTSPDQSRLCKQATAFLDRSVSSADLGEWWRGIDAGEMVMILDSCHSGAASGKQFRPGPLGDSGFGQLSYDKGMIILAASQPTQTERGEWVKGEQGQTLLLDALEKSAESNPQGSMEQWLQEVQQQLPRVAKQLYPTLKSDDLPTPELLDFYGNHVTQTLPN